MKNKFLLTIVTIVMMFGFNAQTFAKSYKIKSYKTPVIRNYKKGGQIKVQKGYIRKSTGKYIAPHLKTNPDQYKWNNLKK